jgi:hypothetical protein
MPTIGELLDAAEKEETPAQAKTIGALLDAAEAPDNPAPPAAKVPWHKSAATGFMDPVYGSGQLMQNIVPDRAMNVARTSAASVIGAIPGISNELVEDVARPRATNEFNQFVRERDQAHVDERKKSGQEGVDWWRIGGAAANPLSWLGGGAGSTVGQAVKFGVKQGVFQALLQPVTSEGSFLQDKGVQAGIGALSGGTLGGALRALSPYFKRGAESVRGWFGGTDDAAKSAAADQLVDDALKVADADPAKVDPSLYSAMRQEVQDALKLGVDPDPRIMERRADALALPVPIQLTRGQASRDPFYFSWEQNQGSKLKDIGLPLSERLRAQNRQLIENLNVLGAKDAPSAYDTSQRIIAHIQGVDDQLRNQINEAYSKVRNSAGRSASVSTEGFAQAAKNRLTDGKPELAGLTSLADYLPETIARQYNDIVTGKLPLTVDTIQFLDRAWGGLQRGAKDDTERTAIGALRKALNDAPIDDAIGKESMEAYKAARQMAAQRFGLIDANPAYKAVVDGTKQSEPDKFFQTFVAGANVAQLKGLKQLIGPENTDALQRTFLGTLKKRTLNKASDEDGSFSQAAYNGVLNDEVQAPRIRELFADKPAALNQLYRIGRVAEDIKRFPEGHSVNTSNTAVTAANIVSDLAKSEAANIVEREVPLVGTLMHAYRRAKVSKEAEKTVKEAVEPGVTKDPLKPLPPGPKARFLSDLATRAGAASGAYAASERDK